MAQIFGMGYFVVLFDALGIVLGFDFCPHSIIPVAWKSEVPPSPFKFYRHSSHKISVLSVSHLKIGFSVRLFSRLGRIHKFVLHN